VAAGIVMEKMARAAFSKWAVAEYQNNLSNSFTFLQK
jgi:hypothetical protein